MAICRRRRQTGSAGLTFGRLVLSSSSNQALIAARRFQELAAVVTVESKAPVWAMLEGFLVHRLQIHAAKVEMSPRFVLTVLLHDFSTGSSPAPFTHAMLKTNLALLVDALNLRMDSLTSAQSIY
jgi:hypothetical protein